MAGTTQGSRRATTWTVEQPPRPAPRIVRLGRPANDNDYRFGPSARAAFVVAAGAAIVLSLFFWAF
ncbi:hypothetical protein [Reyranella sp.]|uniref:hypothetical protein n=1 Tax=Reyranella sp. TaxID=1929291 RepID=UPI003BAA0D59